MTNLRREVERSSIRRTVYGRGVRALSVYAGTMKLNGALKRELRA